MRAEVRKAFGRFVSVAILSTLPHAPAWSETLADALTSAYNHSGLIEQNRAVLRAADEDVAQAVSALRPVLSWAADVTRNFGYRRANSTLGQVVGSFDSSATISLIASVTIYDGGASRLRIGAAKESVLATRAELLSVEQDVLFRAAQAFMEMRRATETVALRQNNLRVLRREVQAARDRFEVGEVTRTDVSLAEARLASAQSALSTAQGQLVIAQEEYRAAVGRKPGALVTPRGLPNFPGSVDKAKNFAVRNHPQMIRVQHLVTANELGIEIAKANMKPTVTGRARLGYTDQFGNNNYSSGGSISLNAEGPIYQGGRLSSIVRQAMAQRDQTRAGLHLTRHSIQQNVGNAYVQLEVARANRRAFESQVRAARVAFQGVREEATLGARTTLDVLDAEQELLDAQANLISAQVDEQVAAYAILSATGQLTAAQLKLSVPQYDPSGYYNLVKGAPGRSKQGDQLDRVLKSLGKN